MPLFVLTGYDWHWGAGCLLCVGVCVVHGMLVLCVGVCGLCLGFGLCVGVCKTHPFVHEHQSSWCAWAILVVCICPECMSTVRELNLQEVESPSFACVQMGQARGGTIPRRHYRCV